MPTPDDLRAQALRAASIALSRAGVPAFLCDLAAENIIGELSCSSPPQLRRMLDDETFRHDAEVYRTLAPAMMSRASLDAGVMAALRVLADGELSSP